MTEENIESREWKNRRFGELCDIHHADLLRFVIWITGNSHKAEDILQESFSKAWEKRDQLRDDNRFFVWMRSICINVHNRVKRTEVRAKIKHVGLYEEKCGEVGQISEVEIFWQELEEEGRHNMMHELLQALPPSCREVFVLFHAHNLKIAQIAESLDISKSTVKQRLAKARKALEMKRKSLEDDFL